MQSLRTSYVARVRARAAEDQTNGTKNAGIKGPAATTRTSKSIGARTMAAKTPSAHFATFGHDRVFMQILHWDLVRRISSKEGKSG